MIDLVLFWFYFFNPFLILAPLIITEILKRNRPDFPVNVIKTCVTFMVYFLFVLINETHVLTLICSLTAMFIILEWVWIPIFKRI